MTRSLSLVNRVTAFVLAALALVLAGYSATLFGVLRHQLRQQFDDGLQAAFNTLVASVEVETDDVKFEPSDHTIALGSAERLDDARWTIHDERGRLVARSRNLTTGDPKDDALLNFAAESPDEAANTRDVDHWRILQRRLAAPFPKPERDRDPLEHAALVVTVGRSPDGLNASLRKLAALVIALPIAILLLAAFVVRRILAAALKPVRDMADRARRMAHGGEALGGEDRRLPVPPTNDELSDLGQAFNSVLDRLHESLERRRRFADNAAHQLRTPLTAIAGQLDVALRRERPAPEYRQALAVVRDQADELRQIVESLMFLARSPGDGALPDASHFELSTWLTSYVAGWSVHPRFGDLVTRIPPDPACLRASPVLLKQLLDNLIDNAFKYSATGAPVGITLEHRGHSLAIQVDDQGIGIAPDDQKAIFEPFFRSAEARRTGAAGIGLGLALASRIAAALGGELTCDSQPLRGSRFKLLLPIAAAERA